MNKFKRAGLVALQLLVVLATVSATVIMFLHPACVEHMLTEIAGGVAAGLLLASVKALAMISRPIMARKSVSCWCRCWWSVMCHEVKCGLVGGYLLGVVMAMWACWNG